MLASVLLHAALLLLVLRLRIPAPEERAPETIEISVNYVAPKPPPATRPEPSEPAPAPEPRKVREPVAQAPKKTIEQPPAAGLGREGTSEATGAPAVAGGGREGTSEATGAPAVAGLEPGSPAQSVSPGTADTRKGEEQGGGEARDLDLSIHSETGSIALGSGGGRGFGETWRNEPGGFPDPDALRAAGAAEGKRNVDGWLRDGLATSRARNGVDPYFSDLGKALEKEAALESGKLLSGDAAKDLLSAYQDGASRYSKTGNPYAAGATPGFAPQIDGDTPLATNAQRFQGSGMSKGQSIVGGGVGPDALRQKLEMGRSLRDFADGKFGNGLLAIVELRQGSDGRLLQLTLTQPSGNAAFDAHVMRTAPAAVGALAPPPEKGIGIHPEGLRSTWSFEGRIVYKRKLSDMSLLRDGWYLALMGLAGLNTGTFDETTGEVEVPDFRHPEFKLKVKLLKVY
ncbi:MAG TPA: TonB C-terminal domain-containing protein [Myxococcales bacterium]